MTGSTGIPSNYADKWAPIASPVALGDFDLAFPVDGSLSSADALAVILDNDNQVLPVGLLVLVQLVPQQYRVLTLHDLQRVPTVITRTNALQGQVLGVQNDVHELGTIVVRRVIDEGSMLAVKGPVIVPKTTAVAAQYASAPNVGHDVLQPLTASADTEEIKVHICQPVPVDIMRQTIGKMYKPKELYDQISGWNNSLDTPHADLAVLRWLRASMTLTVDADGDVADPATCIGTLNDFMPQLNLGVEDEEQYIINQMKRDLPGRFASDSTKDAALAAALTKIHTSSAETAAAQLTRDAARDAKTAKTWENYSPFAKDNLSKLLKQDDETKFPEVYLGWVWVKFS